MSLRTDIQDAIDDVTPPALGLESRVRAMVLADGRARRVSLHVGRRSPWNIRFRGMGALAAAALVVVLIASFVIGGRLWRDWGNGNLGQASINQSGLHNLESKPNLLLPLRAGEVCPFTPDPLQLGGGSVAGTGPVYLLDYAFVGTTNRGDWLQARIGYVAVRPGLVLIRARDLVTGQPLVFIQIWVGANGATVAGAVLGTDQLNGDTIKVYPEAVLLDPSQLINKQGLMPPLVVTFAIPRMTLCWGLQFDGPGFSETYVNGWDTAQDKGI